MKGVFQEIQDIAKVTMEIAFSDKMMQRRMKWRALNDLKWNGPVPIIVSLENKTFAEVLSSPYAAVQDGAVSGLVITLLKQQWYASLDDDRVIEPWVTNNANYFDHGKTLWGVETQQAIYGASTVFLPSLFKPDDIYKMRITTPTMDSSWTMRTEDRLHEILGETLDVLTEYRHRELVIANFGTVAIQLMGQARFFEWCIDYPETIIHFIGNIAKMYLQHNEDMARWRRLNDNHCFVPDFYPWCGEMAYKPDLSQMWVHGDSQDFEGVSPEMTEAYFLVFLRQVFSRFGMASFGCCESLNKKLGYVKTLPNLRRVTISEKTDWDYAIDMLGKDFVYSVRPCLVDTIYCDDEYKIKEGLRKMVQRFKGLQWEINFPGVSTFNGDPQRLHKWVQIAREVTEE